MSARHLADQFAGHGTKPGLHAQTLISTGQADLDRLLGGGLPLGSVLVILEDAYSQHHVTLLRYFIAEGLACGQAVHWASSSPSEIDSVQGLPQLVEPSTSAPAASTGAEKEDDGLRIAWQYRRYLQDKQKAPEPPKKSGSAFQRKSAGSAGSAAKLKDWCHSFDLTRPMKEQKSTDLVRQQYSGESACDSLIQGISTWTDHAAAEKGLASRQDLRSQVASAIDSLFIVEAAGSTQKERPVRRLMTSMASTREKQPLADCPEASQEPRSVPRGDLGAHSQPEHSGSGLAQAANSETQERKSRGGERAKRVAVQSLGAWQWGVDMESEGASAQVVHTVHRLKHLARSSRLAVMVSVPAGLFRGDLGLKLQHVCDSAIILGEVSDDSEIHRIVPDAKSCCGTLRLTKLPGMNTLAPNNIQSPLFLIRHKRRSLALQPFEVDPDAEGSLGGNPTSSASSAASLLCGGPAKADQGALDF